MSGSARSRLWRSVLAVLYAVGVFWGGMIDVGPLPALPEVATDKALHALVFFGLELVLEFALLDLPPWRRRLLAALGSIGVGGLLELVQSALPYRSADLLDWLADGVGAVAGALFSSVALRWVARTPTAPASEAR